MLKAYNRIDIIRKGNFCNLFTGEWVLPGRRAVTYETVPRALVVIFGPLIGVIYALSLPIIGTAIMVALIASRFIGRVGKVAGTAASFNWRPTESYLAGKKAGLNGRRWR